MLNKYCCIVISRDLWKFCATFRDLPKFCLELVDSVDRWRKQIWQILQMVRNTVNVTGGCFTVQHYLKHKTNKMGVVVKHECLRRQQSTKLAIFSIKVTVKVTKSLTLVSFSGVSLVEYACHIWNLYHTVQKVCPRFKFFFATVTDRQSHRQTELQTGQTLDPPPPPISFRGHKKVEILK